MGQKNETVLSYLEDEERFAELFNQLYLGGSQVVDAKELVEASEVYHGKPGEKGGRTTEGAHGQGTGLQEAGRRDRQDHQRADGHNGLERI